MEGEIIDNLKDKIDIIILKKLIDDNKINIKNNKNTDNSNFDNIV